MRMSHPDSLPCFSNTSQPMTVPDSAQEDHKWSAKKMEGDEGFKTLECLRKRLLAERQASRLAKLEEDSMGNKLIELERKLKEEVKLREKFERKLKFLKKKLESSNIASTSGESEQSYSSKKRENSCRSPTSSSTSRDPEEENETKSPITNPVASDDSTLNVSESSVIAKDYDSQVTDDSSSSSNPSPTSEDTNKDESRVAEESSVTVTVTVADNEGDDGDFVDNSLAIVPVNLTSTKQAINPKPVNESVIQVLDALRDAREKLMGSMGARQMVQVGP